MPIDPGALDRARMVLARRCADAEATIIQLTEQLGLAGTGTLPPSGTPLSAALLAEADALAAAASTVPTNLAIGFRAGQDVVLRGLRARAEAMRTSGADDVRPPLPRGADKLDPPASPSVPPPEPPGTAEPNTGIITLLQETPEALTLPSADRDELTPEVTRLIDLRRRVQQLRRALDGRFFFVTGPDADWRNALAGHLRAHADTLTGQATSADAFTAGYDLATRGLAGRLRARADAIGTPASRRS